MERREKVMTAEEAAAFIKDGDTVAVGGFVLQNKPMAVIRALVRRRVKDLFLVEPGPAGIDADMLIGANCVRKIASPGVHMEMMSPVGPRFRLYAQTERLDIWEASHNIMHTALRASSQGLAFLPTKAGLGSDILRVNPDLKLFHDPIKGQLLVAVPAITPNVGIVHTLRSDLYGNAQHGGGIGFFDPLIVRAAEKVIVVTEKVVPQSVIKSDPTRTTVSCENVIAVVEAPYGAHPCSSWACYPYDEEGVKEYVTAARNDEAFAAYLDKYVYGAKSHNQYLGLVGIDRLLGLTMHKKEMVA